MSGQGVLVVGAGAAGLVAALSAHEAGSSVRIIESESIVGGASRLSGGRMMAAGTAIQRRIGIQDHPDDLFFDYLLVNQFDIKHGLARRIADEAADTIEWLINVGVEFEADVYSTHGERRPRSHGVVGGGARLIDVLAHRCRERGIEINLGTRVDRLVTVDGSVRGVAVGDDEFTADAVVLATGGFGANSALVAEHLPRLADKGDWAFYTGPNSSRGDGLSLGAQVGASAVGHDRCTPLLVPQLTDTREFDAFLPAWMLLLDADGRRICAETTPYAHVGPLVDAAGGRGFGFFDARTLRENGTPELPTFHIEFPPGQPKPAHVWTTQSIRRLLRTGAVVQADTIHDLAVRLGLPSETVRGSVSRYNGFAADGNDQDFLKDPRFVRAIEVPPFYGVEVRPAAFGHTDYGLEIDPSGAVLDRMSTVIRGLYAAGECSGGAMGTRYAGSGNALTHCLVFGRAAGRSAADFATRAASGATFP